MNMLQVRRSDTISSWSVTSSKWTAFPGPGCN